MLVQRKIRAISAALYTRFYAALHGIEIGSGCRIDRGATVRRISGGRIILGDRVHVHSGAMLLSYGGDIRIGERSSVNPYSILYGHGGLTIGRCVRIAAHCVIIPSNHGIKLGALIHEQPETRLGIHIEDDVWLGAGARILDGTVIRMGAVVAAGAVARGELQRNGIYGGVPAKLIRERS